MNYQEPQTILGAGLFGDDDRRADLDRAFSAFREVCAQDRSPIGSALRDRYEAIYPDFASLWRDYDRARQAEALAARASVKTDFVALGKKIDELNLAFSSLDDNWNLRRYLINGLRREIGEGAQVRMQEPLVLIERVVRDLDVLSRVCRSEAELQHRPGGRANTALVQATERMRHLILDHGGVRVPKSLAILKAGGFENAKVETFYQLLRCVDARLTPSQARTALMKLPKLSKPEKIRN